MINAINMAAVTRAAASRVPAATNNEDNWQFAELACEYDPDLRTLYARMCGQPRPGFTFKLLENIRDMQALVRQAIDDGLAENSQSPIDYVVFGSRVPGVFNLGGDLGLFYEAIENQRRDVLESYAIRCIDVLYGVYCNFDRNLTTIALLEGDALGGGFEGALSCDVIIAEKGTRMGFPEALFNVFPGMGAYSFLARRIAPAMVERMITSGKLYTAEEMYDMGVVDVLAEPGEGQRALVQFVRKHKRSALTRKAVFAMRDKLFPVTYEELKEFTLLWVDTALSIPRRDLKMMERIVTAQTKKARAHQVAV